MTVWAKLLAAGAAALVLGGVAQVPAQAQSSTSQYRLDPSAPLNVGADESSTDPDSCTTTLRGKAEVTQDRTRLRARTLKAFQTKGRSSCGDITRVEGKGDVYYVTPVQTVRADEAIYDLQRETATFTGNVIAVQGKDVTATDRLVVNIKTSAVQMNGRVKAVIYPSQKAGSSADGQPK